MDYAAGDLYCKGKGQHFISLSDVLIIGKAVEHSWRLSYRPQVGQLPLPVEQQTARDIDRVNFSNIYRNRTEFLGTVPIKVQEQDATLAIEIARHVLEKLEGAPLCLHVLTCDHTGPSGAEAHDLLMTPLRMAASNLERGLYSVESVCRVIGNTLCRTMNWAEVLCADAIANFHREFEHRPSLWKGRVLVLIQLGRGRDDKLRFVASHALLLLKDHFRADSIQGEHKFAAGQWTRLWGWQEFDLSRLLRKDTPTTEVAAAAPSTSSTSLHDVAVGQTKPDATPSPQQRTQQQCHEHPQQQAQQPGQDQPQQQPQVQGPSLETQWHDFLRKMGYGPGSAPEWIQATKALEHLQNVNKRTPIRYVVSRTGHGNLWLRADGCVPKQGSDWKYDPARGGGDNGSGPILYRRAFLCSVFMRGLVKPK